LPGDLPKTDDASQQPCILDLRYVRASAADATAVEAWIKFHASARTPVLILANTDTTPGLVTPFLDRRSAGHVIVIGAAAPGFAPDIAVTFNRTDERAAYEALTDQTDLTTLLNDTPEKARNDEASLARDHAVEPAVVENAASTRLSRPADSTSPIDRVLLRAVQLHRTLLALKRL
jgi:hypothetical protein